MKFPISLKGSLILFHNQQIVSDIAPKMWSRHFLLYDPQEVSNIAHFANRLAYQSHTSSYDQQRVSEIHVL